MLLLIYSKLVGLGLEVSLLFIISCTDITGSELQDKASLP